MNLGDFKREWAEKMGESIPAIDQYLAVLREDGLIEAAGRGRAASDMSFDDALNLAISLSAGDKAAQGPELVKALRAAPLSRGKTHIPSSSQEIRKLGATGEDFASVMRALAEKAPIGVPPRRTREGDILVTHHRRDADMRPLADFLYHYQLQIDFHIEHAIVDLSIHRFGKAFSDVTLPDNLYLRWFNDRGLTFDRRRIAIGRDEIRRFDWWLPYILRLVIDWRVKQ